MLREREAHPSAYDEINKQKKKMRIQIKSEIFQHSRARFGKTLLLSPFLPIKKILIEGKDAISKINK